LQRMPDASCSSAALNSRYLAKLGSSTSTAGSGYRPSACGLAAATASAALPAAIMVRLVGSMDLLLVLWWFAPSIGGWSTEHRCLGSPPPTRSVAGSGSGVGGPLFFKQRTRQGPHPAPPACAGVANPPHARFA